MNVLCPRLWVFERNRRRIGGRFLSGEGIEIGALHRPFPMPRGARVRYLDRHSTAGLREEYPDLADEPFAEVELIGNAETLADIPDNSQDFVVASHVLEHTEDPIGTLQNHLRVLRCGAVVLLALPDRRQGLDAHREPTPLHHVLADHADGPERSRAQHYREWAELVDLPLGHIEARDVETHAAELERQGHSIHFHCWTLDELLAQLPEFGLPAAVAAARPNHHEFLVVLRKAR